MVRPQFVAQVKLNDRFFQSPQSVEKDGVPERGFEMTRIKLQGALKAQLSVGQTCQLLERNTKVRPKGRIVRLELDGFIQGFQSLIVPPQTLKGCSQIREVFRFGILPDGVCEPFNGEIVVPLPKGQHTHEMKRVRMKCVALKSLPAADLRVEKPFSLDMTKSRFIERSDAAGIA